MAAWLAIAGAGYGIARSADPPLHSLEPPVLLPDGGEFKSWEQPLRFSRTYHVDAGHPRAADTNPGTPELPFATIGRAAQVLQPGERVVVAGGVYRECVRPARGGSGPERMISYEAAPGADVVIKGSRVWKPPWQPVAAPEGAAATVWHAALDPAVFDGYNPFAIDNVTPAQFDAMRWAQPLRGKPPYTSCRGMIFEGGTPLRQVATAADLAASAGVFWVDRKRQVVHARFHGDQPPAALPLEITTQQAVIAPQEAGLGYVRIRGFTIEHAAGPFPFEQVGAISTTQGHHWIIEDNTVRWSNGIGIDLGRQYLRGGGPPGVGFHIVRRNLVSDCGICGIAGLGPGVGRDFGLLIEDNRLVRNALHDVESLFETGGIKTHRNVRCLIRRNVIADTRHGPGIWLDCANSFSRCTGNIIVGTRSKHGGIFLEASDEPNLVDQNVIWKTDGHGIYEHDCAGQIFVHNLIAHSSRCGLHLHGRISDREVDGRTILHGRHAVRNNVIIDSGRPNDYRGEPSDVAHNIESGASATLTEPPLAVEWRLPAAAHKCPAVPGITHDLFGDPRPGGETCAGPFAEPVGSRAWTSAR